MICYVHLEHERLLQDEARKVPHLARCLEAKLRLEEITGDACLIQHFGRVTEARLAEWQVRALVLSGNATPWDEYDAGALAAVCRLLRSTRLPVLGICGGWQLLAMAHGGLVSAMRRLECGEEDIWEETAPGYFKEWGYARVRILRDDPLFEGLGTEASFFEAHYCRVSSLPEGFEVLASNDACDIQAARQIGRPVYGVQFHPETYDVEHGAGRRLLHNFFSVAGLDLPAMLRGSAPRAG